MKKIFIIVFFVFITLSQAIPIGSFLKPLDGFFDEIISIFTKNSENIVPEPKLSKVLVNPDDYKINYQSNGTYTIEWDQSKLNKLLNESNYICNKEEARAKGENALATYKEYSEAFKGGVLVEKLVHEHIIKALSKKIIELFGITRVEIITNGTYPFAVKDISVNVFSACGYEVSYSIENLQLAITAPRVKGTIK